MAVAIWDHHPAPRELLDRRLQRGWRPTPTATVDGDVILGYAIRASGRLDVCRSGDHVPE
jgi:mRNA-degrading endonuclease YafQ of YafQ-DinJ toxin-antitoxin module